MSSAKREMSVRSAPGAAFIPFKRDFLTVHARGSMDRSNRRHDRGSPCHTPRVILKVSLRTPFTITRELACSYRERTVLMNL